MEIREKQKARLYNYRENGYHNYISSPTNAYPGIYNPWPGISGSISWIYEESLSLFGYFWCLFNEYLFSNIVLFGALGAFVILPSGLVSAFRKLFGRRYISLTLKRCVDFVGALLGLILTSPIYVIIPILIKLDSPGPVFFRQLRIGMNRRRSNRRTVRINPNSDRRINDQRKVDLRGSSFAIYKFRTMRQDAEKYSGPIWATRNDPRITYLGKFLRASRLDELPQLFNVLKGEMSLVGPRPERSYFIEKLRSEVDSYEARLCVKPGITGLAQVERGYDQGVDDVRKKVGFDLEYVRRWNILNDFRIMIKTVAVVITGRGL